MPSVLAPRKNELPYFSMNERISQYRYRKKNPSSRSRIYAINIYNEQMAAYLTYFRLASYSSVTNCLSKALNL